jgi:predicted nucleotide-binding protein
MSPQKISIPASLQNEVLLKSRRRCALCYSDNDTKPKQGDIALLAPPDVQPALTNLVYLCTDHLTEIATGRLPLDDVASARDQLYHALTSEIEFATDDLQRAVLVVDSRDMEFTNRVLQFLEMAGLKTIRISAYGVLGRPMLEKLEQVSQVGYALVLLTADDTGGRLGEKLNPRPRQNVIFELGYLIGRLGRNRVIAIAQESMEKHMELPSDFLGIYYISMGKGEEWKRQLALELGAVGLDIPEEELA